MTKNITITAILTPEEGGYVVRCPELEITTEGDTKEEALKNIKEAVEGYIEVVGLENIPYFNEKNIKEEIVIKCEVA